MQRISVMEAYDPELFPESTYCPYPLIVLNGITLGDGIDGLEEYLISEGYWFTSQMDAYMLTITVYFDSYRNNYLWLVADAMEGTISEIGYHYGKASYDSLPYFE